MVRSEEIKVIVIAGPTAVGKSKLSLELAMRLRGEIVSADSMQVYRGMDIGTAKPSREELSMVPHHMIDILDPDEEFNVSKYVLMARETIAGIGERGRLPILVGGTGLYIRSLLYDYLFEEPSRNPELREEIEKEVERVGSAKAHKLLAEVDSAAAARIHPNDKRRIVRALEVYRLTGRPISELQAGSTLKARYHHIFYALTMDREKLYKRIDDRVDQMIENGLLDEVRLLLGKGYERLLTSSQAIGYKEFVPYIKGEISLDEAIERLKRDTRRYAKRQLTWLKKEQGVNWVNVDEFPIVSVLAGKIIEDIKRKLPLSVE